MPTSFYGRFLGSLNNLRGIFIELFMNSHELIRYDLRKDVTREYLMFARILMKFLTLSMSKGVKRC